MAEELKNSIQVMIDQAEKDLEGMGDLIERLKKAGERTVELESKYRMTKNRVAKWKEAFKE